MHGSKAIVCKKRQSHLPTHQWCSHCNRSYPGGAITSPPPRPIAGTPSLGQDTHTQPPAMACHGNESCTKLNPTHVRGRKGVLAAAQALHRRTLGPLRLADHGTAAQNPDVTDRSAANIAVSLHVSLPRHEPRARVPVREAFNTTTWWDSVCLTLSSPPSLPPSPSCSSELPSLTPRLPRHAAEARNDDLV